MTLSNNRSSKIDKTKTDLINEPFHADRFAAYELGVTDNNVSRKSSRDFKSFRWVLKGLKRRKTWQVILVLAIRSSLR